MSSYNKYINTFDTTANWKAYCASDEIAVPNVAYLQDTDTIKYLSTIPRAVKVGSIVYSDKTFTWPDEDVDTTKTPIGVVVISQDDTPFNDGLSRFIYTTQIANSDIVFYTGSTVSNPNTGSTTVISDGIDITDELIASDPGGFLFAEKVKDLSLNGVQYYLPSRYELVNYYNFSDGDVCKTSWETKLGLNYATHAIPNVPSSNLQDNSHRFEKMPPNYESTYGFGTMMRGWCFGAIEL